jgi:hypothetical protein
VVDDPHPHAPRIGDQGVAAIPQSWRKVRSPPRFADWYRALGAGIRTFPLLTPQAA